MTLWPDAKKELEIQRDNELAKAEALGSAEELLQSIRDHYAAESIKVEQTLLLPGQSR